MLVVLRRIVPALFGLLLSVAIPSLALSQTNHLIGAVIADGVNATPGQISIVQVYNPSNSGVVLYVTSVEPAWNGTDTRIAELNNKNGFDMGFNSEALGSVVRYMINTDASITSNSPIELRTLATATPYPTFRLFFEKWPPQALYGFPKTFSQPLRIPPGYGMMVRPAQTNTYNIVSVEGYTVPVE